MKNIITHRKTIALVLFTICLIFSVEGTSHGFFGGIFGAIVDIIGGVMDVIGIVVQVAAGGVQIAAGVIGLTVDVVATVLFVPGSISDLVFFPFLPNSGFIGIAASNHIGLWDPETMTETARFQYDAPLTSIAFSPNGDLVASGSVDNTLQLWNPRTHTLQATLRGHTGAVLSVVFSTDGTLIASGSMDDTVRLWNPQTRTLQATLRGHTGDVLNVVFSPDGSLLASGSADGTVRLWDPQTRTLQATLEGHTEPVLSIAFSPDGSLLTSGSADDTVRLWDPETGTPQDAFDFESDVLSLAFNPAGTLLAIGSVDGTARLWDLAESEIIATLGHESPVENVVFTPDGARSSAAARMVKSATGKSQWMTKVLQLMERMKPMHPLVESAMSSPPATAALTPVPMLCSLCLLTENRNGVFPASRSSTESPLAEKSISQELSTAKNTTSLPRLFRTTHGELRKLAMIPMTNL